MSSEDKNADKSMTLAEHLIELRRRLLYCLLCFVFCFGFGYYFAEEIFQILCKPLVSALGDLGQRRLIYTGLAEAFLTYLKVAFFVGVIATLPFLINQIWLFIAPGLYKAERKLVLPFLFATPFLFAGGVCFAYFFIMPNAWEFFLNFESLGSQTTLAVQLEARVTEYLSIAMQLIFAFGLCFQLPVALTLLARLGILSVKTLARGRKYAFLLILIISAMLTPPDVLSQLGLAVPLYILYELSLVLVWMTEKRKKDSLGAKDSA